MKIYINTGVQENKVIIYNKSLPISLLGFLSLDRSFIQERIHSFPFCFFFLTTLSSSNILSKGVVPKDVKRYQGSMEIIISFFYMGCQAKIKLLSLKFDKILTTHA